uniref:Small ribosomal subunit protein uS2c n=2 Tax=Picocystis salinarum TaxID=88271 RepID=A0A088CJ88_9CHLO|nr:ribosomal protein S2 [Picocystis salinarum]AID67646.1 ribosomal protein S2 [Picocystis salinarum]
MKSIEEMVRVGMHFGHQTRKWNPKMAPFLYGQRNGIHVLDLVQTHQCLQSTCDFLEKSASENKTFLFVGTKKQAGRVIAQAAGLCNGFFVNQRWLGGMLTNWSTLQVSLKRLEQLENQSFEGLPKKEAANLKKEWARLNKYLGGLKSMKALPDVVILVGQPEEINAVRECRKLKIPVVAMLDSNCDPTMADWGVPANDDSVGSIQTVLECFVEAIQRGNIARLSAVR